MNLEVFYEIMNKIKIYLTVLTGLMTLFACNEKNIQIKEDKHDLKIRKINYEVNDLIKSISKEITNSDEISTCEKGKLLINKGVVLLPFLKENFLDSTQTNVYSSYNKRKLTIGEINIILASNIKEIPIAYVVGVQQCIPPFDFNIEHYLDRINDDPTSFILKYAKWITE